MEKVMEQNYCLAVQERATIYTFLKIGFEAPLTLETLKLWKETFSPEFIEVLTEGNLALARFFEDLKTAKLPRLEQREKDAYLGTFNLLNSTGKVPAPPWESVYVTRDQTLFGDPVFQLRDQLAQFSLQFVDKNKQPEDHIAIELEFMRFLNRYTWEAMTEGNAQQYEKGVYTQYWMHKEHFQHWIQQFTSKILSAATSDFYKGLAILLQDFVAEDFEYIQSIKGDIENE